jgi:hypothetical protein
MQVARTGREDHRLITFVKKLLERGGQRLNGPRVVKHEIAL